MEREKIKCSDCDILFRDRYNMWRHFMRKHYSGPAKVARTKAKKQKPTCSLCGQEFYKNGNLKRHSKHCKKTKASSAEEFNFNNVVEFEDWKRAIEGETKSRFVKKSGYKLQNGSFRTKYCCHRSGFFKTQSKSIRRTKAIGSNKINGVCPAQIIAVQQLSGKMEVSYLSLHSGHTMELERLTLSKSERAEIAEKIALDIPFKDILGNLKNSSDDSKTRRHRLLTNKDLHNIEKEFMLSKSTPDLHEETAVQSFPKSSLNVLASTSEDINENQPEFGSDHQLIRSDQLIPQIPPPSVLLSSPVSNFPLTKKCVESSIHQHVTNSSTTKDCSQRIEGIAQQINEIRENYATPSLTDKTVPNVQALKDEIRNEFERVLISIESEEQAMNAKKWINIFNSFVHSTNFPFHVIIADENAS